MIDISYSPKLSLRSQCDLLHINRSSYYYKAVKINEIYLDFPFYGPRKITAILNKEFNISINRKKVLRLMKLIGIEPIYQKSKKTTIANRECPILCVNLIFF